MKTCYPLFFIFFFSNAIAASLAVPNVAVTANTTSQNSNSTNGHQTIITAKQIKQSGATNLEEVLNGMVGLQLNDLTGDGSQVSVSMRGFGANAAQNSLILINGMPLDNPDLSAPNLNLIPVNSIKAIEIYNGSQGVLFGDQAVGGVINIITKTPMTDSMYVLMTMGSYDTNIYQEGFQVIGKNQIYASVNVKKLFTDNFRDHNQDDIAEAYGSVGQQLAKYGWNVNYDVSQQLLDLAGALTAAQVAANRQQAQNQINFTNTNYQTFQFQQYDWLTDTWEEKLQAMHRNLQGSGVLFNPYVQEETENWGQVSLIGLLNSTLLNNGISYDNANYLLNSSGFLTSDNQQEASVFSQATVPLLQKLNLIVGARGAAQQTQLFTGENSNANPSAFVTNLGLNYQWNPFVSFFVRRAGNYRFPKADEQAFTANGIGGLKTQTGASYELGVNANKNRWSGTASLFILNLQNEIAFNPTPLPSFPFGVNSNLDPTRRIGGLVNANYQLTPAWLIGADYTHVSAKISEGIFQNNDIPFVAENTGSLYSDYQFLNYWSFFSKVIFVGSRFADGDDANAFPKLPAVTLLNLALRYQRHYLFAVFRINNVFNHEYNSYSSVNTVSAVPFQQQQFFYPAPGRNFLFTVGFDLA